MQRELETSTVDRSSLSRLVARHTVAAYFVLAYAFSWTLWLPRVATAQGWWDVEVPEWWHYAGAAGPISAAIVVSWLAEGRNGLRTLAMQYSPSRVKLGWLAFAVGGPLALTGLGLVLVRLVEGAWPHLDDLSSAGNLPPMALPATLLVHLLTFAIGEETGWRGFALPRLQRDHTAMRATHLLAIGWILWHLPTFFENESFMDMPVPQLFGWLMGLWMGAIFLTWLYNSSGGSLVVVVAWHALFNQFSASEASSIIPALLSAGVILTALYAIRVAGPEQLTGLSIRSGTRHAIPPGAQ